MAVKKKQSGRKKPIILLVIIGILLAAWSFMTFVPFEAGIRDYVSVLGDIALGSDLEGGAYAVMEADYPNDDDGNPVDAATFEDAMQKSVNILRSRLAFTSYKDAKVLRQGERSIRIEAAALSDAEGFFEIIRTPALLEVKNEAEEVILSSEHVKAAAATYDNSGKPSVVFEFTDEGKTVFSGASSATLTAYLDGSSIGTLTSLNSVPIVNVSSASDASSIAMLLDTGKLPLTFTNETARETTAAFGDNALKIAAIAAIVAVVLVLIALVVYYKGLGLASALSLIVYVLLVLYGLTVVPNVWLTLPGIAALAVGFALAVDINVLTLERIRDDYKLGKAVPVSVRNAFNRAVWPVLDTGVVTVLLGAALALLGGSAIRGLGVILIIGTVVSAFCAALVSRMFVKLFIMLSEKERFLGLKRGENAALDAEKATKEDEMLKGFKPVKHRKKYFIGSLAALGLGVVMMSIFAIAGAGGLNLGMDYRTSTVATVQIGSDLKKPDADDSNFNIFAAAVTDTVKQFDKDTARLRIQIGTPQLSGHDYEKAVVVRYLFKTRLSNEEAAALNADLQAKIEDKVKAVMAEQGITDENYKFTAEDVAPPVTGKLAAAAVWGVLLAAVLVFLYVALRFGMSAGLTAVVILLHNVLAMVALAAILRINLSAAFISAVLAGAVFSVVSAVVVFDRLRENVKRKTLTGMSTEFFANYSVKQTMVRTVASAAALLLPVLALAVIGVPGFFALALPLFLALLLSVYSTVFLSGSVWVMFRAVLDKAKAKRAKSRAEKVKENEKGGKKATPPAKA